MAMSLSGLLKVNCSTYENPHMDSLVDQMEYDLDDCAITIDKLGGGHYKAIKVYGIGLVDVNDVECNDNLDWDKFKKELGEDIQRYVDDIYNLKEVFEKYGLDYEGLYFYTPKYYNYESDSVDIRLKTNEKVVDFDIDKLGLRELIQKYIDEVRQESYDGYCSFEPTNIDEVGIDDYCTIRAILEKEGIRGQLKNDLDNYFEEGFDDLLWYNSSPYYTINRDWDTKYVLDYDNKVLLIKK